MHLPKIGECPPGNAGSRVGSEITPTGPAIGNRAATSLPIRMRRVFPGADPPLRGWASLPSNTPGSWP